MALAVKPLGKVRDLPAILRRKLPADTDPDGEAYFEGTEPHQDLRVREADYQARAKEAAALLDGSVP